MTEPDVASTKLDPDCGDRFQPLRRELGVESFGMNLMILQPGERSRIHRHAGQEEVYLVLEGELTLGVEAQERLYGVDEIVRVGAPVRRQLVNRGPARLVMLALGGIVDRPHAGRDASAWTSWDEPGDGRPPQEVPVPDDLPAS